jgi:hypothetical protein
MQRSPDVQQRHRARCRFDLHVNISVGFLGLANMQGHVDQVADVPIRPIAGADLNARRTSPFGIKADPLKGQVNRQVLRASFHVQHFDGHGSADVIAAEAIDVFQPLIFRNRACLHE